MHITRRIEDLKKETLEEFCKMRLKIDMLSEEVKELRANSKGRSSTKISSTKSYKERVVKISS